MDELSPKESRGVQYQRLLHRALEFIDSESKPLSSSQLIGLLRNGAILSEPYSCLYSGGRQPAEPDADQN